MSCKVKKLIPLIGRHFFNTPIYKNPDVFLEDKSFGRAWVCGAFILQKNDPSELLRLIKCKKSGRAR
jgi:hypothetical protein